MVDKNKDKVIIGLIIAVVLLFANTIVGNNSPRLEPNKISLIDDNNDEIIVKASEEVTDIDSDFQPIEEAKVHITGEIKRPGVYTIYDGDRLDDLVRKAGGLTDIANDRAINLAMKLEDQMKIYIPSIYEDIENDHEIISLLGGTSTSEDPSKININTASKEELMTLPNIGEKRAEAIIEYREENIFQTIEDIKKVTGIGEKYFEAMKDLITV